MLRVLGKYKDFFDSLSCRIDEIIIAGKTNRFSRTSIQYYPYIQLTLIWIAIMLTVHIVTTTIIIKKKTTKYFREKKVAKARCMRIRVNDGGKKQLLFVFTYSAFSINRHTYTLICLRLKMDAEARDDALLEHSLYFSLCIFLSQFFHPPNDFVYSTVFFIGIHNIMYVYVSSIYAQKHMPIEWNSAQSLCAILFLVYLKFLVRERACVTNSVYIFSLLHTFSLSMASLDVKIYIHIRFYDRPNPFNFTF